MSEEAVRAFFALEIPDTVRGQLASSLEEVRQGTLRARWTRPQSWHLTLKFLGEVDRSLLGELGTELAPQVRGIGAVSVKLAKTGFFPSSSRPRVAWIGGTAEGIENIVAAVEEVSDRAGFSRERRPWSIHLTLARLKAQWPKAAIERFLEWGDGLELEAFTCREVVLFSSDLQPGGAVYTALERYPLV